MVAPWRPDRSTTVGLTSWRGLTGSSHVVHRRDPRPRAHRRSPVVRPTRARGIAHRPGSGASRSRQSRDHRITSFTAQPTWFLMRLTSSSTAHASGAHAAVGVMRRSTASGARSAVLQPTISGRCPRRASTRACLTDHGRPFRAAAGWHAWRRALETAAWPTIVNVAISGNVLGLAGSGRHRRPRRPPGSRSTAVFATISSAPDTPSTGSPWCIFVYPPDVAFGQAHHHVKRPTAAGSRSSGVAWRSGRPTVLGASLSADSLGYNLGEDGTCFSPSTSTQIGSSSAAGHLRPR